MVPALLALASYAVGTYPTAERVGRRRGFDPLREGSGNPGASNSLRLGGRRAGAMVLCADVVKGAAPAYIGWQVGGHGLALICGLAAVAGHVFPVQRGLAGGKGVATAAGMVLVVDTPAFVVAAVVWMVVFGRWRLPAAASLAAAAALPIAAGVFAEGWCEPAAFGLVALIVAERHRGNVRRLLRGEEASLVVAGAAGAAGARRSVGPTATGGR